MDIENQMTPVQTKRPPQPIQSSTSSLKKKIMCKFFIMGNCIKGDNCCYLHSEEEKTKMIAKPSIECPMYTLGCCKNGPMCKYQHIKKDPISSDSLSDYPELPLWYIEHYFDKPIEMIFAELERQNTQEIKELKEKYGMTKKKHYSNYQYDVYADKKDTIISHLNQNVIYYLIQCANYSSIRFSMEHNLIIVPSSFVNEFEKERRKVDNIVLVIFDMENMNYSGFVLFKKRIDSNEELLHSMRHINNVQNSQPEELKEGFDYVKIEWLWRTKLHYTKLAHMVNPLEDKHTLCEEIKANVGFYACRMMIKRLSKDEVRDLVKQKHNEEEDQSIKGKTEKELYSQLSTLPDIPSTKHHFQQIVHSEIDDKKVYVTNINNLQVNINNHTMAHYHTPYQRKKRERSRSISKSRSRSRPRYYQRRDEGYSHNSYDKRYYCNYRPNDFSYKRYRNEEYDYVSRDHSRAKYINRDDDTQSHKPYKNKLFSNAMDQIHTNSNRRR